MGKLDACFSRKSDEWSTPQALFDALDREFSFTLDAAATRVNRKVPCAGLGLTALNTPHGGQPMKGWRNYLTGLTTGSIIGNLRLHGDLRGALASLFAGWLLAVTVEAIAYLRRHPRRED